MSKYGSELGIDGDFSTPASWIVDAEWSIAGDVAVWVYGGTDGDVYQEIAALEEGKTYRLEFEIIAFSAAAGSSIHSVVGGTVGNKTNDVGVHVEEIVMGSVDSYLKFNTAGGASGSTITIDNVTIREVLTPTDSVLDAKMLAIALRLINKYGLTATFHVTDDTYDPSLGKNVHDYPSLASLKVSPPSAYESKLIGGDMIKVGDMQTSVPASGLAITLVKGMRVEIGNDDWSIISISKVYSGEQVALYKLQLRL